MGYTGWCMDEMGMQMDNIFRHFGCQNHGLTKTADTIAGLVAPEILEELGKCLFEAWQFAGFPPPLYHPQWFIMQIFRQICNSCFNLIMYRMGMFVGWMAQGHKMQFETGLFQPPQFLGNKGFRQAWIAFEDYGDCIWFHGQLLQATLDNRKIR